MSDFRNGFAQNIFAHKYAFEPKQTWAEKASQVAWSVSDNLVHLDEIHQQAAFMQHFKFMPGGRYIYYAGRQARFYNNCYLLRAEEDTREEWGEVANRASSCLMTGGGIGIDYSRLRAKDSILKRTGGKSSGPLPLMNSINEIGRNVMQGGSRRSAMYASLNWAHGDVGDFLKIKDWGAQEIIPGLTYKEVKEKNFNAAAPLDMTNISVNYDDAWLAEVQKGRLSETFLQNVRFACTNGEPGFSFNFGEKSNETLRNACTEVTSEDDSDVCNLGSVNMGSIGTLEEFREVVRVGARFLICGSLVADLPYQKVAVVRNKNRRIGLGLMGIHEWLIKRGYRYEMNPELESWLEVYETESEAAANELCDKLSISRPVAYRAIAPTGTIGILAGTTTGIEPLYAVAYRRRYLTGKDKYSAEYVVDNTAELMVNQYGVDPDSLETASSLAADPERRIKFQADVQKYVDMSISSTLNLPAWGSEYNNEDTVESLGRIVSKYAKGLRGLTFYPDGARGGQPLTAVDYQTAKGKQGVVFEDNDACKGGVCGV